MLSFQKDNQPINHVKGDSYELDISHFCRSLRGSFCLLPQGIWKLHPPMAGDRLRHWSRCQSLLPLPRHADHSPWNRLCCMDRHWGCRYSDPGSSDLRRTAQLRENLFYGNFGFLNRRPEIFWRGGITLHCLKEFLRTEQQTTTTCQKTLKKPKQASSSANGLTPFCNNQGNPFLRQTSHSSP